MTLYKYIHLTDISDYRQLLMGIGIFGVMFSHWFGFQDIDTGTPFIISTIVVKLVFTEGFLFLSGFGLYYSFSADSDIYAFYKKRFLRLYVPFFLLSFPLYLYFLFIREGYGVVDFVTQITTLYFWINGNYGGMWYVSLSIALYLIFPFLFYCIFKSKEHKTILIKTLLLILSYYLFLQIIETVDCSYYEKISIGIDKIVFFIIGILFGFEVKNKMLSDRSYLIILLIICILYASFTSIRIYGKIENDLLQSLCNKFQKLSFMPVVCVISNIFLRSYVVKTIYLVLNWFGRYSLELYIIHLHLFMFFKYGFLKDVLPISLQASLAMILALVLCVPAKTGISKITNLLK